VRTLKYQVFMGAAVMNTLLLVANILSRLSWVPFVEIAVTAVTFALCGYQWLAFRDRRLHRPDYARIRRLERELFPEYDPEGKHHADDRPVVSLLWASHLQEALERRRELSRQIAQATLVETERQSKFSRGAREVEIYKTRYDHMVGFFDRDGRFHSFRKDRGCQERADASNAYSLR